MIHSSSCRIIPYIFSSLLLYFGCKLTKSFILTLKIQKGTVSFLCIVSTKFATSGTELIDQIKVILPHMIDCRDFPLYKASLVLGGTALMLQKPAVPFFLLYDHEEIFMSELVHCARTKDAHTVHANRIKADSNCQVRRILLLFPDGMVCAPVSDGAGTKKKAKDMNNIKICLRKITKSYESGKSREKTTQEFYPAYWIVRVYDEQRRLLKSEEEEEEDDDDIEAAFQVMKLSNKTKNPDSTVAE